MVNAARFRSWAALLAGAAALIAAAWLRGAEYDEQYTLFLTAGTPRPAWPDTPFQAGAVAALQAGHANLAGIAHDLRATDVHPPLYFWVIALWRDVFGPGLFAARLFSVACGTISLGLVARIARRSAIPEDLAVALTLGCYGFAYTSAIARGFAPAEMLTLAGVLLLTARRPALAGAAFGAACASNYLAVFVAVAACGTARAWRALAMAAPFLALDAWFFAAQHGARPDQFPPFALGASAIRLSEYQVAAVFGGLPLYSPAIGGLAVGAGAIALLYRIATARPSRPVLAAAGAPPIGLLLLGAAFDNTPIELRYLSFGLPFVALLAAPRGSRLGNLALPIVLTVQAAGIAGLLLAPGTMQPARAAATQAARFVSTSTLALLPAGNDGVGIPGAFGIEAPPTLDLLLVHPGDPTPRIPPRYDRVILVLLGQDRDSLAALPLMREAVAAPNWRQVAIGANIRVYERGE